MRLLGVVLLLVSIMALAEAAAAEESDLTAFLGTYVGEANAVDIGTGQVEERDIVVEIRPYSSDGFLVTSDVIFRVDGQRAVPGVKRRLTRLLFQRVKNGDYFAEAEKANPFRKRNKTDVLAGDAVQWARLEDARLIVNSFILRDDGRFELEVYTRTRTEHGLAVTFERVVDGEVTRRVTGQTVRAE